MAWKTQTKTSLILLSAFLSIILFFSIFVYFSVTNYSYEDFYGLLEVKAIALAEAELGEESGAKIGPAKQRDDFFEKLPREKDYIFQFDASRNFEVEAKLLEVPLSFFEEVKIEGKAQYNNRQSFFYGLQYENSEGRYVVIASAENYFETHHSAYLKRTLFFAIAVAFQFSLFIALYFSKYIFQPLNRIAEKVKQISSENLHLRLEQDNKSPELDELSMTFNDMLDRLETSFETQNNFISNASHELRTPLTAIIGEADVVLSKLRTEEEYREALRVILEEAEKLDNKTKALLFLAQTGFNGKVQKYDKVRIDQLLWDVKETIEKINPKSKVFIDTSLLPENPVKLKVKGNEQLLHLAFSNIVSNACKYSNYQTVHVSVGASDDQVFVAVKDKGIGIPQTELRYIYDPFFRASNTRNFEGYGIGLPLTRNIIRMHKGEMQVSSVEGEGTIVQVRLPVGNFDLKGKEN
jgi:signal transduction histidine kinase